MRTTAARSSRKKLTQEQLDKALDDHAVWLERKTLFFGLVRTGRRADFTGCDLRDLDFSERDLRHVIFKGALVTRANFDGATLDSNLIFAPIGQGPGGHTSEASHALRLQGTGPRLASVCPGKPSDAPLQMEEPWRASLGAADPAHSLDVLMIASAVGPAPSAPAVHQDDLEFDWDSFVNSRTCAEPQRWKATIEDQPFTWHPALFPRPSAPPLEYDLEL